MKDRTFHKYQKIKMIGHKDNKGIFTDPNDDIVIQEKIDGANFRFMYVRGKFIFGSHNLELIHTPEDNKSWGRCIGYIKRLFKKRNGLNKYIFYGECCIQHSTPYDYITMPPFLGFDIYDLDKQEYIYWKDAKQLFEELGLHFVPVLQEIKAKDIQKWEDKDVPQSKYGNIQAEGVVFKNHTKQIYAKYVTQKHKEECTKVFGGSKKWATNDTDKMVATYCTNPRIEKKIFELIYEEHELEMELMKYLPNRVFEDIVEEHYKDILCKNYKIDVGQFRKAVAKRCLSVLKQSIVNSTLVNI